MTSVSLSRSTTVLDTVAGAVDALRAGRPVIVVDDEDRENEGDLIMAAEFAAPKALGFFVRWTSGLICTPMAPEIADRLELPLMVAPAAGALDTTEPSPEPYLRVLAVPRGGMALPDDVAHLPVALARTATDALPVLTGLLTAQPEPLVYERA